MPTRATIITQLTAALGQFPEAEAYLFGSYARDQATEDSDVDVALIWDAPNTVSGVTTGRIQQIAKIRGALRPFLPHTALDVLWYSPPEWEKVQATQKWFAQEIQKGIRLA